MREKIAIKSEFLMNKFDDEWHPYMVQSYRHAQYNNHIMSQMSLLQVDMRVRCDAMLIEQVHRNIIMLRHNIYHIHF